LKLIVWVLKNFWFPILIFVLSKLAEKYVWAEKAHRTLKRFK
jgi:hypothetical protein